MAGLLDIFTDNAGSIIGALLGNAFQYPKP